MNPTLPPRSILICACPPESLCSARFPPPALCRRGCTVPGEGWSPADTEHSREAHHRRRRTLRRIVRCTPPLVAQRTDACVGIGTGIPTARAAPVAARRRVAAVASGGVFGSRRPGHVAGRERVGGS